MAGEDIISESDFADLMREAGFDADDPFQFMDDIYVRNRAWNMVRAENRQGGDILAEIDRGKALDYMAKKGFEETTGQLVLDQLLGEIREEASGAD